MVLFQDILTFMGTNVNPKSDILLFQSMLKVFYLFKIKFQFYDDELSEVWIYCTCCNKNSTVIFLTPNSNLQRKILLVFIKSAVFHHVGISWMIVTKDKYNFAVDDHYEEWFSPPMGFH